MGAFILYNVELRLVRFAPKLELVYLKSCLLKQILHHRTNLLIDSHIEGNSQSEEKTLFQDPIVENLCITLWVTTVNNS